MRLRETALGAVVSAGLIACQLVGGIDGREVEVCAHATLPEPPPVEDGLPAPAVVLATTLQIAIDQQAGNRISGFDLDGVCSDGTAARGSCERHPGAAADFDDPDGRDNGALALLARGQLGSLFGFPTSQSRFHLLVEIKDWNGSDDPKVSVGFYLSDGVEPATESGAGVPRWQGDDVWTTRKGATFEGRVPNYFAQDAYVTGGKVVGKIPELVFAYGLPIIGANERLMITLSDVQFSLPVTRVGTTYQVEGGVIAGRWQTSALLTSLAVIPDLLRDASPPENICGPTNETYKNIRDLVCVGADITRYRSSDSRGQRCDALSIVFGVTAVQARIGKHFDLPMPVGGCGPTWIGECPPL